MAESETPLSIIERAEKLNKETAEAEKRILEHRKVIEELETRRIMSGQSRVEPPKVVDLEKEANDRAQALLAGSGLKIKR